MANSSMNVRAIAASCSTGSDTAKDSPTNSQGSSCSNALSATSPPDLDQTTGKVPPHEVVLRARALAGGPPLPRSLPIEAPRLGEGDADHRLLGTRVDRVIVHVETEGEGHPARQLVEQRVGLVHRWCPAPGDALLATAAETGLVARGSQRAPIGSLSLGSHRAGRRHVERVLDHRHPAWIGGVHRDSGHEAGNRGEVVIVV